MANEEQIGFHKGAISTLVKERQELVRMIGIVDTLISAHVEALKKLGIDVTQQAGPVKTPEAETEEKQKATKKKK